MYILALKNVQSNLDASSFTQFRQLVDTAMRSTFKYAIYAALICNLLLVFSNIKSPGSLMFITALIAVVALSVDIALTLKGNLPVNDIINTWTFGNYPPNWTDYCDKWFMIFEYRQISNMIGFLSLLIGAVFSK
jgi:hypothetical protein